MAASGLQIKRMKITTHKIRKSVESARDSYRKWDTKVERSCQENHAKGNFHPFHLQAACGHPKSRTISVKKSVNPFNLREILTEREILIESEIQE